MTLHLYNTLTRKKEEFVPLDPNHIKMYVCGPTVYDAPHIGNARSVVVYDVLYRLLSHLYPKVTYARNITDVDDKINVAARERGITIQQLTTEVTEKFHADMDALNVLRPDVEPRATQHIGEIVAMIETLIARGHAYVAEGHVLFDITSDADYGKLSRRSMDDMVAGARVEVAPYKKNPGDFVLWKPAAANDDPSSVFASPWSKGRPGWHIECSAMSTKCLGDTFDLHGGGADLMFPHHENEIAQSECATGHDFAKTWVHNGFLTVNGEKMSKSLGNFITVRDLLEKGVRGEDIRFALLSTKYSEPLDWNDKLLHDAKLTLDKWYRKIPKHRTHHEIPAFAGMTSFIEALTDDLNLPKAFSLMHAATGEELYAMGRLLGFCGMTAEERFKGVVIHAPLVDRKATAFVPEIAVQIAPEKVQEHIAARTGAKKAKNWAEADRIRAELKVQGIILEDRPDGTTDWRRE